MDNQHSSELRSPNLALEDTIRQAFGACPTHWLVCQLADRWTLPVLSALQSAPKRFAELQEELHPISHRMLSRALQKVVRMGLVTRTVLPSSPPQVHYEMSPLGHSLSQPLARLVRWSQQSMPTRSP